MSANNADRHYPDGTDILMAAREDSERFYVRTPVGSIMSVPALDADQARQLAADEYRGFGPGAFEVVDADAEPDYDAYPDPVDSDRPVNEHDLWMLRHATRAGSRAGIQARHSRKNPTDHTISLALEAWDGPTEIPLADPEALQEADGIGPHRAAQLAGAAVANRLVKRVCRPGTDDGTELVTDGGQPTAGPGEEAVGGEVYEYPFSIQDYHGETVQDGLDTIPPFLDQQDIDTLAQSLEARFEDGLNGTRDQILVEVLRKLPDRVYGRGKLPTWIVRETDHATFDGQPARESQ